MGQGASQGTQKGEFYALLLFSAAAVMVLGLAPRSVLAFAERSILSLLM